MNKLLFMSVGLLIVTNGYGITDETIAAITNNDLPAFKAAVTPSTNIFDRLKALFTTQTPPARNNDPSTILDKIIHLRVTAKTELPQMPALLKGNRETLEYNFYGESLPQNSDEEKECLEKSHTVEEYCRQRSKDLEKSTQTRCEMIKYLKKDLGVDLNKPNKHGRTPLHEAVNIRLGESIEIRREMVSCLVGLGADVNAKTPSGKTPLEIVGQDEQLAPIRKLLENAPKK